MGRFSEMDCKYPTARKRPSHQEPYFSLIDRMRFRGKLKNRKTEKKIPSTRVMVQMAYTALTYCIYLGCKLIVFRQTFQNSLVVHSSRRAWHIPRMATLCRRYNRMWARHCIGQAPIGARVQHFIGLGVSFSSRRCSFLDSTRRASPFAYCPFSSLFFNARETGNSIARQDAY